MGLIHETALVDDKTAVGAGTRVGPWTQVREGARIGPDCRIGARVTVDAGVIVGERCTLVDGALLYRGVRLGRGVFVGPGAVLSNDRHPRAITPDGDPLGDGDWSISPVDVDHGASIGANATVVAGVRLGAWAMVGAGAVVTRDVPAHALVVGVPARQVGWVCACGAPVRGAEGDVFTCAVCGLRYFGAARSTRI